MEDTLKIKLKSLSGADLGNFNISPSSRIDELKLMVNEQYKNFHIDEQKISIQRGKRMVELRDYETLDEIEEISNSGNLKEPVTVFVGNQAKRVDQVFVFLLQSIGLLLCHWLCFYKQEFVYCKVFGLNRENLLSKSYNVHKFQYLAFFIAATHFAKQIFEILFVYRFGRFNSNAATDTKSLLFLRRQRISYQTMFKRLALFQSFCGLAIAYFLYHPIYQPMLGMRSNKTFYLCSKMFIGLFMVCELFSLYISFAMRSHKKFKNTSTPSFFTLFGVLSPNYTFELYWWLIFSVFVRCLTCWIFTTGLFAQLYILGSRKVVRLKSYSQASKTRNTKVYPLIPFLSVVVACLPRRRKRRQPQKQPSKGLLFPIDENGQRSTTYAAKAVFIEALNSVDAINEAEAVHREKNQRFNYNKHFMKMVEVSAQSPESSIEIARKALEWLHSNFQFRQKENGEAVSFADFMKDQVDVDGEDACVEEETSFDTFYTGIVYGNKGKFDLSSQPYEVFYKGKNLSGASLLKQLDRQAKEGQMEMDTAHALKRLTDAETSSEYCDLSKYTFVLIGTGSAMGPYSKLLDHGANIVAIDIGSGRPALQQRLIERAKRSPGTLIFPLSQPQDDLASDEAKLYESAGCDLLTEPHKILRQILKVTKAQVNVTIGNYTYLDGANHVRLSIAADAIISGLIKNRRKYSKTTNLAFLCTPTDIHAVPPAAYNEIKRNSHWHFGSVFEKLLNLLSGGKQLRSNLLRPFRSDEGRIIYRVDGLSIAQGPNYALAKRIQHWRAMLAYEEGSIVSSNIAPSTRTLSVVHNRTFAQAYNGMPYFRPFEIFEQETTNSLMAGLLIHDVCNTDGPMNPVNRDKYDISNSLLLFSHQSLHGGLWRCSYKVDSIGFASVLIHFLGGPNLVLPVLSLVSGITIFGTTAFVYYILS